MTNLRILHPEWQHHAACLGTDPDLFFPTQGCINQTNTAKAICAGCPVRPECLDYALATFDTFNDHGVWGGTSKRQRDHIRRTNREQTA